MLCWSYWLLFIHRTRVLKIRRPWLKRTSSFKVKDHNDVTVFLKPCSHVPIFSPIFTPIKNGLHGDLWGCSDIAILVRLNISIDYCGTHFFNRAEYRYVWTRHNIDRKLTRRRKFVLYHASLEVNKDVAFDFAIALCETTFSMKSDMSRSIRGFLLEWRSQCLDKVSLESSDVTTSY